MVVSVLFGKLEVDLDSSHHIMVMSGNASDTTQSCARAHHSKRLSLVTVNLVWTLRIVAEGAEVEC